MSLGPDRARYIALAVIVIAAELIAMEPRAQHSPIRFEHISVEEGLSQYSIRCILQDRKGFMWFGTQEGLNRFDGYTFRTFNHDPSDSTSLSDSYILSLHEDAAGRLWIGTLAGGLNRLNLDGKTFTRYPLESGSSGARPAVRAIDEDQNGLLWLGTSEGLVRFDPTTGASEIFHSDESDLASLADDAVQAVLVDASGRLWVASEGGLYVLDPGTGRVVESGLRARGSMGVGAGVVTALHDDDEADLAAALREDHDAGVVTALHEDRDGRLLLGRQARIDRFDPSTGSVEHYAFDDAAGVPVSSVVSDRNGRVWIGRDGGGVSRLDVSTGEMDRFVHESENVHSLSDNRVFSVFVDRTGVIWVGTWSGLNKVSPLNEVFTHVMLDADDRESASENRIVAFYEPPSEPGIVWIGTLGGGMSRYDPRTGEYRRFRHDPGNANSLSDDDVLAFLEDRQGRFWIGTRDGGLNRFDRRRGRFVHYRHDPADPYSLSDDCVLSILEDGRGRIWIGTRDGGLNRFDPETERFMSFGANEEQSGELETDYVWPLLEDRAGALWVGTYGGGLYAFDRETHRFTRFQPDAADSIRIETSRIFSIVEGRDGVLWLGTQGGGLVRFDPEEDRFEAFTDEDGLLHSTVLGIEEDDSGHLWLSTGSGLSRFDPAKETFTNYAYSDGLQSNVFHVGAHVKTSSGLLLFGGANGFNIFDPEEVRTNEKPPPVVLTSLRVFDKPYEVSRPLADVEEIDLRYDENFFSFEFAALDFSAPDRNRYAYRLENFDRTWVRSGTRRFASYTNVPPGRYVFRVQAANSDGTWNTDGLALNVTIAPPFWNTWWFYGLVAVLVVALATIAYRLRVAQLLKVERMRARIAGDLHDDIGANLSSIAIKSEMLLAVSDANSRQHSRLSEISRSARETAHVLREIVWVVNSDYDSLEKLITKLEDTTSFMLDGGPGYSFEGPTQLPEQRLSMDFRQNVVFLYKEVLHNIVKHAAASYVSVRVAVQRGMLEIQVSDDGVGFDPETVRAGNGLKLMKRRAEVIGGRLEIGSSHGEGTRVRLEAPLA